MLKEARIAMPYDPQGLTYRYQHDELRRDLIAAFGGVTVTKGEGSWNNEAGHVAIYDIAMEAERDATWDKLFQIAMKAGRQLGQKAVYIRYPDGSVEIADVAAFAENSVKRPDAPQIPLGAKRTPQVGEIWETSEGAVVAVIKNIIAKPGGGLDVVMLKHGTLGAYRPGTTYEVDLDGKVLPDQSSHPRDLKRFVKDF